MVFSDLKGDFVVFCGFCICYVCVVCSLLLILLVVVLGFSFGVLRGVRRFVVCVVCGLCCLCFLFVCFWWGVHLGFGFAVWVWAVKFCCLYFIGLRVCLCYLEFRCISWLGFCGFVGLGGLVNVCILGVFRLFVYFRVLGFWVVVGFGLVLGVVCWWFVFCCFLGLGLRGGLRFEVSVVVRWLLVCNLVWVVFCVWLSCVGLFLFLLCSYFVWDMRVLLGLYGCFYCLVFALVVL